MVTPLESRPPAPQRERDAAVRRVRLLNNVTIGWNVVEGVVAIVAGLAASSVSLLGFGLDSGVEVATSGVLAWRLHRERLTGCRADDDRLATRLIALCFGALAIWVAIEAARQLIGAHAPDQSIPGIVLAAVSLTAMPLVARAKRRLAPVLGSQAVRSEARQTELCAVLSAVVLVGLGLNAALGWWWADPVAALGVAGIAGAEGLRTWRAEALEDTCCA